MNNPFKATQRHVGELIAEWSIRTIASLSIVVIFLIFIFVFREASTLLTGAAESESAHTHAMTPHQDSSATSSELEPEVYNPDTDEPEKKWSPI